ncbi:MAG: hypothetical protein M1419_00155 [Bacteroidetes bacterium]|nr:hypothetical protein [Bacteroidota bacterium]
MNYTSGNYVLSMEEEGNYLWVGTYNGGLIKLNKSTYEFEIFNRWNSGLPNNQILSIAIDSFGNKWIGTKGGLAKFDGLNWTIYDSSNSEIPSNYVNDVIIDKDNNIWVATRPCFTYRANNIRGGLAKFDGVNWIIYNISNSGIPSNYVTTITIDKNNNKWIGTWSYFQQFDNYWTGGGVTKFDGFDWTFYNLSFYDDGVSSIVIDKNNIFWVCTEGLGLFKYDGINWSNYNDDNSGLPDNNIHTLAIDKNGTIWMGSGVYYLNEKRYLGGGLTKFDGNEWVIFDEFNSELPSNIVSKIFIDSDGNKWIGTWSGLTKFDGNEWTKIKLSNSSLPNNTIRSLAVQSPQNVWIGTFRELVHFDGTNWKVYDKSNSELPETFVNAIVYEKDGTVWIGTDGNGLFKFDGYNWTNYNNQNSDLPSNFITTVTIDSLGNKWIGTEPLFEKDSLYFEGGLAKFDNINWTIYNTHNSGLTSNMIKGI